MAARFTTFRLVPAARNDLISAFLSALANLSAAAATFAAASFYNFLLASASLKSSFSASFSAFATLFASAATEVATAATARSSAFQLKAAARACSRAAEPPHPSSPRNTAPMPSNLRGTSHSFDTRHRLARPSLPEALTVYSPLHSYSRLSQKGDRWHALERCPW